MCVKFKCLQIFLSAKFKSLQIFLKTGGRFVMDFLGFNFRDFLTRDFLTSKKFEGKIPESRILSSKVYSKYRFYGCKYKMSFGFPQIVFSRTFKDFDFTLF